ncbi:hypothetical protein B0J11DRAFT_399971, partial [Dendryphion nanum]
SYEDVRDSRDILQSLRLPMELVLEILEYARYWPCQRFGIQHPVRVGAGPSDDPVKLCLDAGVLTPGYIDSFRGENPKIKEIIWDIRSRDQGWTSEGTEGTFRSSSWLEVSILRPGSDSITNTPIRDEYVGTYTISPETFNRDTRFRDWRLVARPDDIDREHQNMDPNYSWHLQSNRVAHQIEHYRVLCSTENGEFVGNEGTGDGHGFLQSIQPGDRILVWARARYAGWQCNVDSLTITVYYGF